MVRKLVKKLSACVLAAAVVAGLSGCGSVTSGKRIVRISHAQSETHPEHLGLLAFKEYVEERLGDKYEVQIFPNELLGSAQKAIELTQTGAIDFVVAGTANLETFASVYEIFSMPYLFDSEDVYKSVMQDTDYMEKIYESTDEAGFRVVTWYNAGTRNFYGKKPINTPDDLKGMKIRVQQSPASVAMVNAFGAAAAPMSFGEVYTAIQQGVIDGAENNELALTNNKHGEVAKYYSYNKHQMVPDMLVANLKFLNGLSPEEYQVFKEAAAVSTEVEMAEWDKSIEEAKDIAINQMGVQFIDVDVNEFKQKVRRSWISTTTSRKQTKKQREDSRMETMLKIKAGIMRVLSIVIIFLFAFMTVIGTYQIVTRYFFNKPSTVSEELLTYSFTWMALLASAYVFGKRDHMRMGFLADKLTGSARKALELCIDALTFALAAVVLVYGGISITRLTMIQTTASLRVPMGYIYVIVPVTGILIMLFSAMNAIQVSKKDFNEKGEVRL